MEQAGAQGATATPGDWYNSQPRGGHVSNQDATGPISKSPMPEYWCSIAYFELDTQVRTSNQRFFLDSNHSVFITFCRGS